MGSAGLQRSTEATAPLCKSHSHKSTASQGCHLAASGGCDCKIHICDSADHEVCDLSCFTAFCKCFTFVGYKSEELSAEGQFSGILPSHYCSSITSPASFTLREKNQSSKTVLEPSHIPAHLLPPHFFSLQNRCFSIHRVQYFPSYFFMFNHY